MIALSTIPMALSFNPYGGNWLMYVGLFFFGAFAYVYYFR